jgi:orotate phosphoribosyltransferase-like protein
MHNIPPLYQQIADRVMDRFNTGMLITEIAEELNVDKNTVTSTVKMVASDARTTSTR